MGPRAIRREGDPAVTIPIEVDAAGASGRGASVLAGSPQASTGLPEGSWDGRRVHIWRSAIGFAVSAALGVTLALSLGQDANGDQLYSHTLNAWAALHPHQDLGLMASLIPALWDVPWLLLAERAPAWVTVCYLGVLHSIAWFLSWRVAWSLLRDFERRWRIILSVISAGFAVIAPATLSEFATTFGDLPTSIFVLAAILAVINAPISKEIGARRAIVAGGLLGIAFALKLTNAPFLLAGAGALALGNTASWRNRVKDWLFFCSGSVLGAAVVGGYLWIRYWQRFGNPIYPFYSGIFHSPYLDAGTGRDTRFVAKTPLDQLTLPWRMISEGGYPSELPGRDIRWAVIASVGLLVIAVTFGRRLQRREIKMPGSHRRDIRFFAWFMILSWAIWSLQFGIPRYFISIEMLGGIALVLLLHALIASPSRVTFATVILLAATAAAMIVPTYYASPTGKGTWYGFDGGDLTRRPHTMVIFPSAGSINYTIAAFPDDATIVELYGFLDPPNDRAALRTREALAAIQTHNGPVVAVVLPTNLLPAARTAKRTGFSQSRDCQRLRTSYYSPWVCLWTRT
jgi:hypothetical protein